MNRQFIKQTLKLYPLVFQKFSKYYIRLYTITKEMLWEKKLKKKRVFQLKDGTDMWYSKFVDS